MDRLPIGQRVKGVGFVKHPKYNGAFGYVVKFVEAGRYLHSSGRYYKRLKDGYVVDWDDFGIVETLQAGTVVEGYHDRKCLLPIDDKSAKELADELFNRLTQGVPA